MQVGAGGEVDPAPELAIAATEGAGEEMVARAPSGDPVTVIGTSENNKVQHIKRGITSKATQAASIRYLQSWKCP